MLNNIDKAFFSTKAEVVFPQKELETYIVFIIVDPTDFNISS
jgi:hypothetical protein